MINVLRFLHSWSVPISGFIWEKTISGSFRSTSTESNQIWQSVANSVFEAVKTDKYVRDNGLYNKLIMQCSFNDELSKVSSIESDGCRGFRPSITSNGMCYTFNGESTTNIWRPSEVMDTFNRIFPHDDSQNFHFGGFKIIKMAQKMLKTIFSFKYRKLTNL